MAMRVVCVTLLLWAGAQGVRLQKDKDGALQKDSEARYGAALHAALEHESKRIYQNPEQRTSAVEAVSEMFQAFNKVDGQDREKPEGGPLDAKAVDDLSTKNFGMAFNFLEKVEVPESLLRDVYQRRGTEQKVTTKAGRSLRLVLTCKSAPAMYSWVVVVKGRKIADHLKDCKDEGLDETWHAQVKDKSGADTILAEVPWTDLHPNLLKLAGEPLPRMINNQQKLRELLGRANYDWYNSKDGSRYDNIMTKWALPLIGCQMGVPFACTWLRSEMQYKYPDATPSAMRPYIDGLKDGARMS